MREQLYRIPGEQSNGAASWHSSAYKLRMSPVLPQLPDRVDPIDRHQPRLNGAVMKFLAWAFVAFTLVLPASIASAQSPRDAQRPSEQKPAATNSNDVSPEPAQNDLETIKIDTNLVTVPVIASSRTGHYITDLRKEEFKLSEDGVPQEIAFLATVNTPFYVVLMLDTSDSTREKLPQIQQSSDCFSQPVGSARPGEDHFLR